MKKLLFFTLFFASHIALAMKPEQPKASLALPSKSKTRERIEYCCDEIGKIGIFCCDDPPPHDTPCCPACCLTLGASAVIGCIAGCPAGAYTGGIIAGLCVVAKCIGDCRESDTKKQWQD